MQSQSHYVEVGRLENTCLGRDVRFPTRSDAESALIALVSLRGSAAKSCTVQASDKPATTTFVEWNEKGW
jgi:hypothetical protein